MIVSKYKYATSEDKIDEGTKQKRKAFTPRNMAYIVAAVTFFTVLLVSLAFSWNVYDDSWKAEKKAFALEAKNAVVCVEKSLDFICSSADNIAKQMSKPDLNGASRDVIELKLRDFCVSAGFDNIKYFYGESLYNMTGTSASSGALGGVRTSADAAAVMGYDDDLGDKAIMIYVPVGDGEVTGIACIKSLEIFRENIFTTNTSEYTCYLVDSEGSVLLSSVDGTAAGSSVFQYMFANTDTDITLNLKDAISNSTSYSGADLSSSENVMFTYEPVSGNTQWGIVCTKSAEQNAKAFNSIFGRMALISLAVAASFAAIVIYIFAAERRYSRDIEDTRRVDSGYGCLTIQAFQAELAATLSHRANSSFAVVYLGIVNYEYISQNYGSQLGENCLRYFLNAISNVLQTDEFVGRAGVNRFVVAFKYSEMDALLRRYEIICQYMQNYLPLKEKGVHLSIYAGIYPVKREENADTKQMVEKASIAFKAVDNTSRNNYKIYNEELENKYIYRSDIESTMHMSLDDEQFLLYLQPKYNIASSRIDSAEALVRWNYPDRGIVMPSEYIPLFESNGFITELDKYIYIKALEEMCRLRDSHKRVVPFAVNVSRVSAVQPDFLKFYIENKNKYQIPDGYIEIEFTESFALESFNTINGIVATLKENGICCSIDDFGSGYASFSVLKQLQMDAIKMDRLFLAPGSDKKRDEILISAIIKLAKDFNMKVIHEGIETKEEYEMVKSLGCDVIQGYWYSTPLSVEEFESFVQEKGSLSIERLHDDL